MKGYMFLLVYMIVVGINFMTATKYPDAMISMQQMIASIIFMAMLLIFMFKKVHYFAFAGVISGMIIYSVAQMQDLMIQYPIIDVIGSITYPLYFIFTIPLFGLNRLFEIDITMFSLYMSVFYLIVYVVYLLRTKTNTLSVGKMI